MSRHSGEVHKDALDSGDALRFRKRDQKVGAPWRSETVCIKQWRCDPVVPGGCRRMDHSEL
jgi:hypothetical protein